MNPTASHNEIRHCDITGPPSLDPYAKGASTTGDYYSATSAQMPIDTRTTSGDSEYQTAVSSNPGMKRSALSYNNDPPRPLASSTQRKTVSRRNLNPTTTEGVTKDNTPNAIYKQACSRGNNHCDVKRSGTIPSHKAQEQTNQIPRYARWHSGRLAHANEALSRKSPG